MTAHWTKTSTAGYTLRGGPAPADLVKRDGRWILRALGVEADLGRSPSFPTAEAALGRLLA